MIEFKDVELEALRVLSKNQEAIINKQADYIKALEYALEEIKESVQSWVIPLGKVRGEDAKRESKTT